MRRIAITSAIAAFFALVLYTTNGCGGSYQAPNPHPSLVIRGSVLDAETKLAVKGTELRTVQDGKTYVTQAVGGAYSFEGPHAGDLLITITAPGYETQTMGATVVKGYNELNFWLRRRQ